MSCETFLPDMKKPDKPTIFFLVLLLREKFFQFSMNFCSAILIFLVDQYFSRVSFI